MDIREITRDRVGIGGFTVYAHVKDVTDYKCQAPATYLEDGSFVQDHVINEPLTVSIDGVVGDLFVDTSNSRAGYGYKLLKLTTNASTLYLPKRTQSQIQKAVRIFNNVKNSLIRIRQLKSDLFGFSKKISPSPNQEAFISFIEDLQESKGLISIEIGPRTYSDMKIVDVSLTREADKSSIAFSITVQKIRFAQAIYKKQSLTKKPSSKAQANTKQVDKGIQKGKEPSQSALSKIFNTFGN